jgi:hypothetical protein
LSNELSHWAKRRAPAIVAQAEAEAVAELRNALLDAALPRVAAPSQAVPTDRSDQGPVGEALWGFCVLSADAAFSCHPVQVHPLGVPERIEDGDLCAIVGRVPLNEFGENALQRNLNDLEWLERVARAHERVLDQALQASTTVVPLRLCTIFQDEMGVRRMLERERPTLNDALQRLEGCQEWGVKALADRAALQAAAASRTNQDEPLEDEPASGSGTAYLHRQRLERNVRDEAAQLAAEVANDIHSRLRQSTNGASLGRQQNRQLSGHEGDMLLNGAYLVRAERLDEFRNVVAQLERRHRPLGVRLELTGPWPPYNFSSSADLLAS